MEPRGRYVCDIDGLFGMAPCCAKPSCAFHIEKIVLEHMIRNGRDYARHINYIHVNPLKHSYRRQVVDWPYSTFHRYVADGFTTCRLPIGVAFLRICRQRWHKDPVGKGKSYGVCNG
jgi:hypothetical protein